METPSKKVVLVTGASSGIGRAIAGRLVERGYRVFGTSRRPDASLPGVELLALDVRSDESVRACVQAVIERAGRLDALVNNAAVDVAGAVEEVSLDEARALFETNFFGTARMIRAVLPIMRAQGGGQIVNLASGLGILALPFDAYYSASKFAVEGLSEALRHEVRPFNIHVSVVEPGFYRSNIRTQKQVAAEVIPAYARDRARIDRTYDQAVATGGDPRTIGLLVERILADPAPRQRYPISFEAVGVTLARRVVPDPLIEKGLRIVFGLDDWRDDVRRYAPAAVALVTAALALRAFARRS